MKIQVVSLNFMVFSLVRGGDWRTACNLQALLFAVTGRAGTDPTERCFVKVCAWISSTATPDVLPVVPATVMFTRRSENAVEQ
jgi:hypothetical protein